MNPTHVIGGYREFTPGVEAAGFCESVWIHQTLSGLAPAGAAHRVLPEMGVSLAFQGFRDVDGRPRGLKSTIVAGPKLRAQVFDLVPGRELAAIKIKPEWWIRCSASIRSRWKARWSISSRWRGPGRPAS